MFDIFMVDRSYLYMDLCFSPMTIIPHDMKQTRVPLLCCSDCREAVSTALLAVPVGWNPIGYVLSSTTP